MAKLSSTDSFIVSSHEYELLEHAITLSTELHPEFTMPELKSDGTAEIAHLNAEEVKDFITASIELDKLFLAMVKERAQRVAESDSGYSANELRERKRMLKQRQMLGRKMLYSVDICSAFLDFIYPNVVSEPKAVL